MDNFLRYLIVGHLSQRFETVCDILCSCTSLVDFVKRKKDTALRNHNQLVFKEMSSWTALTCHIGMKTAFYTKNIRSKHFWTFIMGI